MLACPLRKQEKTRDDESADDRRGDRTAQGQTAIADRLVEEIPDGGAKRARQDEGGPKQKDARDVRQIIGESQHSQSSGEDKRSAFISQTGIVGYPVSERRSERLGQRNRRP